MTSLAPHKYWFGALLAALGLLAGSDPLLRTGHGLLMGKHQILLHEEEKIQNALRALRADAGAAEKLGQALSAEQASAVLAPADRLLVAAQFEPLASSEGLERFTYTLSPETPYTPEQPSPETEGLVQSVLSIEGEAQDDRRFYAFVDKLIPLLPGRAQLRQISIERLQPDPANLGATNVRFSATIDWLANGSKKANGS